MSTRNETLRRVVYALAMLTGVTLVAMQFGCSQPRIFLHAAGFPHAGRWVETATQAGLAQGEVATAAKASLYWIAPGSAPTQGSQATFLHGFAEGSLDLKPLKVSRLAVATHKPPLVIVLPERGE